MQFNVKAKCPACSAVTKTKWTTSPILVTCTCGVKFCPRQDLLAAVYVYGAKTEEAYLEV